MSTLETGLKIVKVLIGFSVILGGALGGALYTGAVSNPVETPSASVEDIGDWGQVTDDKIELFHTLNVQNPNPVDAELSSSTALNMRIQLNGVRLGAVQKDGLDIQQGGNTVKIKSELQQDRIAEFWSRFINQDETIHAKISGDLEIDVGPGISVSTPSVRVSALTDEQPISDALSEIGDEIEDSYGTEASPDDISERYTPRSGFDVLSSGTVKIEYTVENVEFEWGDVSSDQTELLINIRVRNTGDTRLPADPDRIRTDILLNDIKIFSAQTENTGLTNIDSDKKIIKPGETKSYTLVATTDNQNVEKWFTSYAERKEKSTARVEFLVQFRVGDEVITIPNGGVAAYDCSFQTGIFVDSQSTSTTCGDSGTYEIGSINVDQSTSKGSGGTTPTETATETATDNKINAVAKADKTSGQTPLKVEFDGRSSTASGERINRYEWRFDGGAAPGQGETITRVFEREGKYDVELTVVGDEGTEDTDIVTINVEPRRDR